MALITPKQFAQDIMNMLENSVNETMPEASAEEKEQAKVAILNAWSGSMFTMEMQ